MDAFDRILKNLKEIETRRDSAYYVGVRWGLTMALQILDYTRWLDLYLEETIAWLDEELAALEHCEGNLDND